MQTEHPRSVQTRVNAVVERGHKLMAQIFQGIVRFEISHSIFALLREVGIVKTQAANGLIFTQHLGTIYHHTGRNTVGVELEIRGVEFVLGIIHHPVHHVEPVVVERKHIHRHPLGRTKRGAQTESTIFLGAQIGVAFLRGTLVEEIGESGQAQRFVPRGIEFPVGRGTISYIHPRIEAEFLPKSTVALCQETERNRPVLEQNVVFGKETHVGAIHRFGIFR